jgi:hypothetical protein
MLLLLTSLIPVVRIPGSIIIVIEGEMMFRITSMILFCILLIMLLSSCAPGVNNRSADDKAGFFSGVWHGWIAPITLIWQIFNHKVRIYEVYNTGWAYDFGFYIAVISGFGGLSLSRRNRKKK